VYTFEIEDVGASSSLTVDQLEYIIKGRKREYY